MNRNALMVVGLAAMALAVASTHAQTDGLLIYHKFAGDTKDSSGNGFDGELFGGA